MVTGIFRDLLRELALRILSTPDGVDARKFRAAHEDHLDELDKLEESPYIEKKDNEYQISLLALSEFKNEDQRVESILCRCSHIFSVLRKMYKQCPGSQISLDQLVKEMNLPENQVRKGLVYLLKAPIWSGYTMDSLKSSNVFVTPSEKILKYKTFDDVICQLHQWATKSIVKPNILTQPANDTPLFLQEIDRSSMEISLRIPSWHKNLNQTIQSLMEEVYYGLQKEMKALPSMGLRAVIDVVCNDLVGDIGGFSHKLGRLEKDKHITPKNKEVLENVLEVGHASVHRGYFPELADLRSVLDIVNHLLKEVYVFGTESKRLKAVTPKRERESQR